MTPRDPHLSPSERVAALCLLQGLPDSEKLPASANVLVDLHLPENGSVVDQLGEQRAHT